MRVIAVATLQDKPDVGTMPLLERPADSTGVLFDRMIYRAKVPPRQCGSAAACNVGGKSHRHPDGCFPIAPTARQAR